MFVHSNFIASSRTPCFTKRNRIRPNRTTPHRLRQVNSMWLRDRKHCGHDQRRTTQLHNRYEFVENKKKCQQQHRSRSPKKKSIISFNVYRAVGVRVPSEMETTTSSFHWCGMWMCHWLCFYCYSTGLVATPPSSSCLFIFRCCFAVILRASVHGFLLLLLLRLLLFSLAAVRDTIINDT